MLAENVITILTQSNSEIKCIAHSIVHRVTDVVSFDNVGYATLSYIKDTNKPYLFIAGFNEETSPGAVPSA